jgi:hypothetical protein
MNDKEKGRKKQRKKERKKETRKEKLYKENIFPLSRTRNIKTIFHLTQTISSSVRENRAIN